MPHYAMDKGEPPVIRGKPTGVTVMVYLGGRLYETFDLPELLRPFQTNNMDAWIAAAARHTNTQQFIDAYRVYHMLLDYQVNDGKGRLSSRGSTKNTFGYSMQSADGSGTHIRVDIHIQCEHYSSITQQKIKAGTLVPQVKPETTEKARQEQSVPGDFLFDKIKSCWVYDCCMANNQKVEEADVERLGLNLLPKDHIGPVGGKTCFEWLNEPLPADWQIQVRRNKGRIA